MAKASKAKTTTDAPAPVTVQSAAPAVDAAARQQGARVLESDGEGDDA